MHESVMFLFVYLITLRHNIRWFEVALFFCHFNVLLCIMCTVYALLKIDTFHILPESRSIIRTFSQKR